MIWKSFRTSQLEYIITLGCLLIAVHNGLAAPVYDSTEIDTADSNSCYYNYNHYYEGDRILTNEPCLNCTCHNRMLMCYLRVCPFTKPIGQDCVVERREDQCCPIITCPEVPVELLNHQTTNNPISAVGGLEQYGCSIEGEFYPEGAQVPSNPRKPCELCYCIRNMTACLMQECTLHVDGCQPIYNKGVCCPVRYNCEHDQDSGILMIDDETTTTERPTPGFMITTTAIPGGITECIHDTDLYSDGEMIYTDDPCEHCYCMKGDIVCAIQECTPLETRGKNCTASQPKLGHCCPHEYICEQPENTTMLETTDHVPDKTEATTLEPKLPTKHTDDDDSSRTTVVPESMITDSGVDEEPTPREDIEVPSRVGDDTDDDKDQDGKLRLTTATFDREPTATTPTSYVDYQHKVDSTTIIPSGERVEITTSGDMEESPDNSKTPVPSIVIKEPVTDYQEYATTKKIIPLDSVEPIDSTTTEINDRFRPDEGTTQKTYDVPTPDLSDDELQQHIDDDDKMIKKKPPQSDDEDKLIDLTTRLYTDIGTTLRPHISDDQDKMDSEEDNTVKPYDSTTMESKDKYPIDGITTLTPSQVSTTQSDSDESNTDSKVKIPSDQVVATTQQSIEDITSHDDKTDDDDSKTDEPQIISMSTLKPSEDEPESTTPARVISTENKTFKMEDQMPTEKYDGLFASFVPGEGSCLLDGVTYANNSIMPPIDVCQLSCTCINSNIVCDNSRCDTSPQQGVVCDAADSKCGEDLVTSTEGSTQGSVDDGDLMAPHEGSAQGEMSCAGDKCDESELIIPAEGVISCADGKCVGSETSTPAQGDISESETTTGHGSKSTTPTPSRIACANGQCDEADSTTPTEDDKSESATLAPGFVPDILIPDRSDASESTTPVQGEIACADGKCDDSVLAVPVPGSVPEFSKPDQDASPAQGEACATGDCDELGSGTPVPGFAPEFSTSGQDDASKPATPVCADGDCDELGSGTPTPGFIPELSTPARGDGSESATPAQGEIITCADGDCDKLGSGTPAPDFIPEFSTPAQSDVSKSVAPVQGEIACADGDCDELGSGTPTPGFIPELSTPARGDGSESATPAQGEIITCADGDCDKLGSGTPAPDFIPEFSTPAQSDVSKSVAPVQGEIACADGDCDELGSGTPSAGFIPELSTPAQGDGAESATPADIETACADGKCDESQSATTAKSDESKLSTTAAVYISELSTTPKGDGSESSTPAQVGESESVTPAQGEILCADGKCDRTPAQDESSEFSTPAEEDGIKHVTPATGGIPCTDEKCDEPEYVTPAQGVLSEFTVPSKGDEYESSTSGQAELPCADGKCEGSESATPVQGVPCPDGKCDETESTTPTQNEISCADDKCTQRVIIQPPKIITPQEGGLSCEDSPDGKCSIAHQVVPTEQTVADGDEYSTIPVQKIAPLDGISCADGKCDEDGILLEGTSEQTPISCADGKCDKPVALPEDEDLASPTQATSPLDGEPINVLQVVTVLPEVQTTLKTDLSESTDATPEFSRTTTTEHTDQQKTTQSGPDDEEQTDKDTIITRIQILPTTTESGSEIDKVTLIDRFEPSEQPDSLTEQSVTDKDSTIPAKLSSKDDSEVGHKTDVNKPSTQAPADLKPTEQELIESSTMSDNEVSEMITSLPVDDVPKVEVKPTETLPTESQNEISEPDTTGKPLDAVSQTTVISDTPISDITGKPSITQDDLELDINLRTTVKPISIDEPTEPSITVPDEPTKETSTPSEIYSGDHDLEKPAMTASTIRPIEVVDLSDKIDSPLVQVDIQSITEPIEKVTDSSEDMDDHDISTIGSIDEKSTVSDIKPDDKLAPSLATTSTPDKGQPIEDSKDGETTKKPETVTIKETTTVKYGDLDNNIDKLDLSFTEKQTPKDDVTETSTLVMEVPHPTVIAPIHGEEPQNQMGVTDQYDEMKITTTATSGTLEPISISTKSGTDKSENDLDVSTPGKIPSVTEKIDYTLSTDDEFVLTTIPTKVSAGITDIPSRIDGDDKEIGPTTASTPEKPVDIGITTPKDHPDKQDKDTTQSFTTTSSRDGIDDSDKPSPMDVEDKDRDVTTTKPKAEPTKAATDKASPLDVADIEDMDVTTPSQDATTPSKVATDSPRPMDDGETTSDQDATDKPTLIDEVTPIKDTTDIPSPIDGDQTTSSQYTTEKPGLVGEEEISPSKATTDRLSPMDDGETTVSQDGTDRPGPIDKATPIKDATDKPTPMDDEQTTSSQYATDKPRPVADEETTSSKDVTDRPSPMDGAETTPGQDATDKPSPIDEATPIKEAPDRFSPIDSDETTPSQYGTDKPSEVSDEETTPSKLTTDRPSPMDGSETTPSQDATDKPSSMDDATPTKEATDRPSPMDGDQQTTPSQYATDKPSDVSDEETTPSKYATDRPSSIDGDEATPGQDATDKPTSIVESTPTKHATDIPSPMDGEQTIPTHYPTDKPSQAFDEETTPSKLTTDGPSPMDGDETTPGQEATDKPSPIDEGTPIKEVPDRFSPIDGDETTPSQYATDKPSEVSDEETTPSKLATDRPSSMDGGETTPSEDATDKPSSIDDATPIKEATDKPSPMDGDDTTSSQYVTDKPSPVADEQTAPSKLATDRPSTMDGGETTLSQDATDKPSTIDETSPIKEATDKPSPMDGDQTTSSQYATDKPSHVDDEKIIPSKNATEKLTPFEDGDRETEIITADPIEDATGKPGQKEGEETTPSKNGTDKPGLIGDVETTPVKDATDKPSPMYDGETTPSKDATNKLSSLDDTETTPSHDDKESDIITVSPTDDATDKPSKVDSTETTPTKDATEESSPIDSDDKEADIITASPIDEATTKPSAADRDESTPSQDTTDKSSSIDSEETTPSQEVTDKGRPTDVDQTTPGQTATEKTGPIEDDDKQSDITTVSSIVDATGKPGQIYSDSTPSQGNDTTDKPSPIDDDQTTPSQDVTDKPTSMDTSQDTTDKPSPIDAEQTTSSKDTTDKLSPFDDDKEPEIITADSMDRATDKPASQIIEGETTPSEDTTDKPSQTDDEQTKPSKDDKKQPISADDDKEPEIITAGPTDDDATGTPSLLEDSKTPSGQKATEPIMEVTTTPTKQVTAKSSPLDDSDKESMDVTTIGETTPSKETTEKPGPIDDSDIDATTSAQITPSKESLDISSTTLPSDKLTTPSEDIDSENVTSESTTAKITKPTPIDDGTTPSEYGTEVTSKSHEIDQLDENTMAAITTTSEDTEKDISATTASAVPTKDVTGVFSPIDDLDKEAVTTKIIEPTSDDQITDKPRPAYDVDDKDMVATTSFAPTDIKITSSNDTLQPTDKPSQMDDDMDKEELVSTTVGAETTVAKLDEHDAMTVIATKLDAEKPQSTTEDSDKNITESTSKPSKEPQSLTGKPDKLDDNDTEGSTPGQDHEDDATDKPSQLDGGEKITTMKYEEFTDKPEQDSEKDMPFTSGTAPTTTSKHQDQEVSVTEVPSRLDDSDSNVTTQQTTPDEELVDELFTKPTEIVKKPGDGYEYKKPPQDKFDYTKQPTDTTAKPESQYTQTITHPLFTTQAPAIMETPGYGGHLPPQPPQYSGNYPDEEYGEDEDPASFGPGTCRYGGKIFVSAQQIPRDDPCDFCFCFRSDIICLQQSCPPPINGCHEEPISGFCCPRYNCHVKMATVLNVTTSTTTTTTTLPPHFMHHAYKGAAKRSGCQIKGQAYQVGEIISSQSGPCMSCICGGDGQMQCEPKVCSPEPMLQQMIAVAAASRRRR